MNEGGSWVRGCGWGVVGGGLWVKGYGWGYRWGDIGGVRGESMSMSMSEISEEGGGAGGDHWWGVMGGHSGGGGLVVKLTISSSLLYLATIKDKLPSQNIRN